MYRDRFKPGSYYHMYSHSTHRDKLFRSQENYRFFLDRYKRYSLPIVDTLAYCLIPNHFHFLIQVKTLDELVQFFKLEPAGLTERQLSNKVGLYLGRWLNSYAKSFNKWNRRRGYLFSATIHRREVTTSSYLMNVFRYIHNNPVKHGIVEHPADWPHSSYHTFKSSKPSFVAKEKVYRLFPPLDPNELPFPPPLDPLDLT